MRCVERINASQYSEYYPLRLLPHVILFPYLFIRILNITMHLLLFLCR